MTDWFTAVLLGIIEGLTEFLPISSTGHLLLAENWLPRQSELFNVVIQCGAVLAVVAVFQNRARSLLYDWRQPATQSYLLKLLAAFLITGFGGLILKKAGFTLPKNMQPITWATLVGGVLILGVEFAVRNKKVQDEVTWLVAAVVGAAQVLAMACPGTSRSGASILFAMAIGLSRPAATEFSFLVGIPTMFTAGAYEIYHALKHTTTMPQQPENWGMVAVGTVVSAITAFLVVKWLLRFVQSNTFNVFGWYRIVLGGVLLLFFV